MFLKLRMIEKKSRKDKLSMDIEDIKGRVAAATHFIEVNREEMGDRLALNELLNDLKNIITEGDRV